MAIEFTVEELNTLILFLAYATGHLSMADNEANDLFESAELLRQRIEARCTRQKALSASASERC